MSTINVPTRRVPFFVPLLNPLMSLFVRLGVDLGPKMALITVRGRRTGRPFTTPITLFESRGRRYVFGTFGNTSWVRNARVAGEVTLTRGRRTEVVKAIPLTAAEALPVLSECLARYASNPTMAPMLKRFYGVDRHATAADFAEATRLHPAFELIAAEDPPDRPAWLDREEYPFASRFIEIGGQRVHYVDEGRGATLLFVHAGPAWSFVYRRVIERLRGDFRCVAIDFPASGPSAPSPTYRPLLRSASATFESFVRRLDLRDVTIVVHDLGGPVALDVATRMPERFVGIVATDSFVWPLAGRHPRVVRMLRLVSSHPFTWLNDVVNLLGRIETMEYGAGRGMSAAGRATFLAPFRDRRARHAALAMLGDAARDSAFLARVEAGIKVALRQRPVLLLFGTKSPTMHERFPARWAELFRDTRLVTVPGAHHFPMVDAPDLVASAIRSWWTDTVSERRHDETRDDPREGEAYARPP